MTSVTEAVEEYHRSSLRRENYKKQSIVQSLQWGKLRFTRRSFRIIPNLHSYVNLTCLILGFSTTGLVIFDILRAATSGYFRSSPSSSRPTVFACKFRWSMVMVKREHGECWNWYLKENVDTWRAAWMGDWDQGWQTSLVSTPSWSLFSFAPEIKILRRLPHWWWDNLSHKVNPKAEYGKTE